MILLHRVSLNGTQLDSLDNSIIIQKVDEQDHKETYSAVSVYGRSGQRMTGQHRDTLDVVVNFAIRMKSGSMTERDAVLDKVKKWARNGGTLALNYKQGKQLSVVCVQLPGGGDQAAWTSEFQMTFRAYSCPYWVTATETALTSQYVTAAHNMSATNNATEDTPIDFSMEVNSSASGTVNDLTVTIAGKSISFANLGMVHGDKLRFYHDTYGHAVITITHNGTETSAYAKRTANSHDELYLVPGSNTVQFSATTGVSVRYGVNFRGRYA